AAGELANTGQLRTALVSVVAAGALVVLKLGTGLVVGSLGLVSAGIESSGDVVAAILTLFAIRLGGRPADDNHPYGHRRAENLAALGVDLSRVLVSVRGAARYRSAALRSNAFHFAGDMAGSVAVLAGLVAVRAGWHEGDAVAALVVAAVIFAAAGRLILENARVLMDTTPARAYESARSAIGELGNEIELRRLRLRESGGHYFADAVVAVPPGQAVVEGEGITDEIVSAVRRSLPDSDVVVHLEPRRA